MSEFVFVSLFDTELILESAAQGLRDDGATQESLTHSHVYRGTTLSDVL